MFRILLVSIALLAGGSFAGKSGGSGQYALGVNLGAAQNGSGFSGLNFRVGQDESLDLIAAWNSGDDGTIIMNGNYLHHVDPILRQIPIRGIVPYVGIGVGIWMNNASGAWLQVPLGLDFRFSNPLEVGLFLAPGIDLIPSTKANMHFGIGFRYWL